MLTTGPDEDIHYPESKTLIRTQHCLLLRITLVIYDASHAITLQLTPIWQFVY